MLGNITTVEEAEHFIYNYNGYKSKAANQNELYPILKDCEQLAIEHSNNKLLCTIRIYLTGYYIQNNDLENALQLCLENEKFSEEESLFGENLKIMMRLIEIYLSLGDYARLEELIYQYEEKLVGINDYTKLCSLHIISAIQASNLKDYEKCLQSNYKAVEYALLSKSLNHIIYAYNNMGYQLMNNNIEASREALENALKIITTNKNKVPVYSSAIVELNCSRLYLKTGILSLSKKLINSSLYKLKKINNQNEINYAKLVLVEIFTTTGKAGFALKLLKEVEENCLSKNNKSVLLTCYQNYIQLFESRNKYKEALEYHKKFQLLNEEIFNEDSNKKIRNLQILNEVNGIKKQRDHAEAMANLKHEFLANMSHEIRTPINSVLGICYLLQQDTLSDKQYNYINLLQQSSENLLSLINDILDMSKIEADKMELVISPFCIKDILQSVYDQMLYKAQEKNINLELVVTKELHRTIKGDPNRLTQVLLNILTNSLKFTQSGNVTINARSEKTKKAKLIVRIDISDTGIGIAEDKLQQIFGRYEQASSSIKTHFGGTGLGLSISKKIVELMGGSIEVKSKEKNGTVFTLHLPFETTKENQTSAEDLRMETTFLTGKRFLIADDNEANRMVMREIIHSFNNTIVIEEASTGLEVLHKISKNSFDLILMDLDMPEKNGLETMYEIRKSEEHQHIKIIAHTASLLTMSREELIQAGFTELLLKPFKPSVLLSKLYSVLK